MSPPVRGAWIETVNLTMVGGASMQSPPVRGAWIETRLISGLTITKVVAPRAGGVD